MSLRLGNWKLRFEFQMKFEIYKWKYKIWDGKNVSQDDDTIHVHRFWFMVVKIDSEMKQK